MASRRVTIFYRELPPRARRIPLPTHLGAWAEGTTSACAENTATTSKRSAFLRNYLRVRGEYAGAMAQKRIDWELPPRARRIPM